jgi:translation initiation factor IF-1
LDLLNVIQVDITDSSGISFTDIPFVISAVPFDTDRYIVTVELPENMEPGQALFDLTLNDGSEISGVIEIIEESEVFEAVIMNKPRRTKVITGKIQVGKVRIRKSGRNVKINVRGKNFPHRVGFYEQDGVLIFHRDGDLPNPVTQITVYPSNLGIKIKKRAVRLRHKRLKIKFKLPAGGVKQRTNAVIVLSSHNDIVTIPFTISPNGRAIRISRK